MDIRIEIDLRPVTRMISSVQGGAERAENYLEEVGEAAQREFGRIMETEGNGGWPDILEKTKQVKNKKGAGSRPILQRTGALFASLTRRGAPGNVFERRQRSLDVGTKLPYARFHQQGTGYMPARPFVFMTPELRAEIEQITARYLEEIASGGK